MGADDLRIGKYSFVVTADVGASVVFTFPVSWSVGTMTATLDAANLSVSTAGQVVTVTVSAAQATAMTSPATFTLLEDGVPIIRGSVTATTDGSAHSDTSAATVVIADNSVTVTALGTGIATSAFGRTLIDDADAAAARTTLELGSAATMTPTSLAADAAFTATYVARGSGGYAARNRRTAGNVVVNSVTWVDVDNTLDLVLTAATGDWVEVMANGQWSNEATFGFLDAVTVVAGSPVNSIAGNGASVPNNGAPGWTGSTGQYGAFGGSLLYQLQASDISGGQVRIRLRARTAAATNKTIQAATAIPLAFGARNHG